MSDDCKFIDIGKISVEEFAMIVSSLRLFWMHYDGALEMMRPHHFEDIKPLTFDEIDALCERIVASGVVARVARNEETGFIN